MYCCSYNIPCYGCHLKLAGRSFANMASQSTMYCQSLRIDVEYINGQQMITYAFVYISFSNTFYGG